MTPANIKAIFEARQHAAAELRALDTRAAGREFTPEERATDERLNATVVEYDGRLTQALDALTRDAAADQSRAATFGTLLDPVQPTTAEYRAGNWLASELRALTGATGLGAAMTPADQSAAVFDLLAPSSVLLASGVQIIRTERDTVAFPHLLTDASSGFVAPGATITSTDPTGEVVTAVPQKIASLLALHNEIIGDSSPAILDTAARSLIRSCGLTLDLGAFEGSGTAPAIRGLKNIAGIQTVSLGANGATPTNLDPFADALSGLEAQNAAGDKAIVMHPRTWGVLAKVKEATGSAKPILQESAGSGGQAIARSIYGVPVFLSSQLSVTETQGSSSLASSAYVYDVSEVYAVLRQDVRVELDSSRLFNSDQSEVRAILRADVVVPNPKAVCRILGILG